MANRLLGTRIRERRKSSKISQKELARIAGISAPYLNLIEHNRRGIAGKTLNVIARALKTDPEELSRGISQALLDRVRTASIKNQQIQTEVELIEEFIARYPGFARLIARQSDQIDVRDQEFEVLSDQLKHDPYFAEAMHLLLSHITTIQSTSDILASDPSMEIETSQRFISNLSKESQKLAQAAEEIFDHFEPRSEAQITTLDMSPFEIFLEKNNFYLDDLETEAITVDAVLGALNIPQIEQKNTLNSLLAYKEMAQNLPLNEFIDIAKELKFDAIELARYFKTDLVAICFRLAHLPIQDDLPQFGLIQCDASGAVLYRKQLNSFSLPRYGGACPLWPVYRSLTQPLQPIRAMLDMPSGDRFHSLSIAYPTEAAQYGMPALSESIMIFTPDYSRLPKISHAQIPQLDVGSQCAVCSRIACQTRRVRYLLDG